MTYLGKVCVSVTMLTARAKYIHSSQLELITPKTKVIFRYDIDNNYNLKHIF